ncbi:dihydrolipoamide acetyltransferase family protein [Mycetocola miduiensis]|uniref:Dihydrolipoamide acetyltransferase component of pyruvate dehydrogenase complex n=1 Tax=Mycetocola miduiensis TaxID=995034 RepID=A0A1I5C8D3_9MICO|nr:dihydrolipoamide acetyltransferase family protein [Mycetocola miduiensis]SFN83187.1 pyruvate dehydrogenase E2 component (dihydrolipoamide acetyltransferase) [Mycetocola miduiensis]
MPITVRMPEVSANATHAVLQTWEKRVGDAVCVGDVLASIETEKAAVDLTADADGTLAAVFVDDDSEVEIGAPLARIDLPGEDASAGASTAAGTPAPANPPKSEPTAEPSAPAATAPVTRSSGSRLFASPIARKRAREAGVDLAGLTGTGPAGRIVRADVERVISAPVPTSDLAAPADGTGPVPTDPAPSAGSEYTDIPHSPMRRAIARRLTESKQSVPHFYITIDAAVDDLLALRSELNEAVPEGDKISINDLVVKACAIALQQEPAMNVIWTDDATRQFAASDISLAVATDTGLLTPVLRGVEALSIVELSRRTRSAAQRAKGGQLRMADLEGGTFTVTSLGMFGVSEFSAIINPPQAGILAVGAVKPAVVAVDGRPEVRSVMRCTLSVDHRAVDGAPAARWAAALQQLLENPVRILI